MSNTALIVVDMVYDFAHPNGAVYYPQNEQILPRIRKVIDECRKHDCLIVFMQHSHREGKFDKELTMVRQNCIEGTGGDELMPELGVQDSDFVIKKRRYSSFYGTDLDLVLREHNIKNVIICGTKTNCCIRATVNDAYHLNYDVIVPRECVATNDETVNDVHLTDIQKYLGRVFSMDELFKWLEGEEK
ncbi:cysteine hydrolase family protein [Peribacillus loiseleuriae]|uniref:Isochorismatase n=1 Tax=Peribacillus loiseleuriae TaxID=1679170 RepID=A0A0K9GXT2_9BACI|nr:isochorismatase family cysteine hydrolase [Peribacillus loiseleuriae]KMY51499.1 isochorismatase [Peribacillus loiseleuriae]